VSVCAIALLDQFSTAQVCQNTSEKRTANERVSTSNIDFSYGEEESERARESVK
jgi:hypothetical protein